MVIHNSCVEVVVCCGVMMVDDLSLSMAILELLLLQLLIHDHSCHLLLHLNNCLRIEKAKGKVKYILALHEKSHEATLIRLGKEMWFYGLNGKWFIACCHRVCISACNCAILVKLFKAALVIGLLAKHLMSLSGF